MEPSNLKDRSNDVVVQQIYNDIRHLQKTIEKTNEESKVVLKDVDTKLDKMTETMLKSEFKIEMFEKELKGIRFSVASINENMNTKPSKEEMIRLINKIFTRLETLEDTYIENQGVKKGLSLFYKVLAIIGTILAGAASFAAGVFDRIMLFTK